MEYKHFNNEDEAERWIDTYYHDFIHTTQQLIAQDKRGYADIIYGYGGSVYKEYNKILRVIDGRTEIIAQNSKDKYYANLFKEINTLSECICKYPISHNITVYRFVNYSLKATLQYLLMRPNSVIVERGFMSTTLLPHCQGMKDLVFQHKYNLLFQINVPQYTPAVPLVFSNKQTKLKEYEMLFKPDTKLKLIKKSFDFTAKMPVLVFDIAI